MDKIKPCPFCGSEDLSVKSWEGGGYIGYIICNNCEAYGPSATDEEKAIRMWNHAPRVGDNDCDYPNFTGGCHIFPGRNKEEPKMEKCCKNCVHISKEVDGKAYCTEEVDANYNCKWWEPVNPFKTDVHICGNCKHGYNYGLDGYLAEYCGRAIGNPEGYVCDKWDGDEDEKESISTHLNPSNSSGLDTAYEIAAKTDLRANVTQLMEEASELIAACSKYLRACGIGQPTPVTVDESLAMIAEEAADVHLVTDVIIRQSEAVDDIFTETANRKILRWKGRLENEEQDHTEPSD